MKSLACVGSKNILHSLYDFKQLFSQFYFEMRTLTLSTVCVGNRDFALEANAQTHIHTYAQIRLVTISPNQTNAISIHRIVHQHQWSNAKAEWMPSGIEADSNIKCCDIALHQSHSHTIHHPYEYIRREANSCLPLDHTRRVLQAHATHNCTFLYSCSRCQSLPQSINTFAGAQKAMQTIWRPTVCTNINPTSITIKVQSLALRINIF